VETYEQTAARLSAQRDYARRQRSCETLEQAYRRRAANRSRSERRRITETPDETATACHCLYLQMYGVGVVLCIVSMQTTYVNKYTVACNEWNSVAYNTTRRRLFCFLMSYVFLA